MFTIYLPIAEISVNLFLLLGLGMGVGFLSGLFGVGGGFLMTPLLIFVGIPPVVAVSTQLIQVLASSFTGFLTYWRRDNVDLRMGSTLVSGGLLGAVVGVVVFAVLRSLGQIDFAISVTYVVLLGSVGLLTLSEAVRSLLRGKAGRRRRKLHDHNWLQRLPFKLRYRRSRLYISIVPPVLIGAFVGLLAAIMGVGGGFVLVPAMVFLLGMPTVMAIGTSLFQIIFVTGVVAILHAYENATVDAVMALLLAVGGVIGARWGAQMGLGMRAEYLRLGFGAIVLAVAVQVAYRLVARPEELYSLTEIAG
ncbi:sulfite exporter TauE/SafE family protein [Marinibaculum pumilum]|uniref:Probable membrane transporter protein n=1 Tax=Marinibaculum pumilum TaxID=1766165 RepID=A0ABV7L4W3_9PROT